MHSELLMLHSDVLSRNYMEKNIDNCGSVSLFNSNTSKLPSKSYCKSILSQVCCPLRENHTLYSNPGCPGPRILTCLLNFIQASVGKASHVQSQSFAEELLPKDSIHHSHHRTASLQRFVVEKEMMGEATVATLYTQTKPTKCSSLVLIDLAAWIW